MNQTRRTFTSPDKVVESQLIVRKLQSYSLMMRALSLENMKTMEKIKFSLKVYDRLNKSAEKTDRQERSVSRKKNMNRIEQLVPIPPLFLKTLKYLEINDEKFQQLLIQQLQVNLSMQQQQNRHRSLVRKQERLQEMEERMNKKIGTLRSKLSQKSQQLSLFYEYLGFRKNPQAPNAFQQEIKNFMKLKQREQIQLQQRLKEQSKNYDNAISQLALQMEETKDQITDAEEDVDFLMDMKNKRLKMNQQIEEKRKKYQIEKGRIDIILESIQDQNLSLTEEELELEDFFEFAQPYLSVRQIHDDACLQVESAVMAFNRTELIKVAHEMPILKNKLQEKTKQNKKMREKVEALDKKLSFLRVKAERLKKHTENPQASTTSL